MPNLKGNDKQQQDARRAEETQEFNLRFAVWKLELLSLLIEQETRTRDRPSDRLINMKETAEELEKLIKEILDH